MLSSLYAVLCLKYDGETRLVQPRKLTNSAISSILSDCFDIFFILTRPTGRKSPDSLSPRRISGASRSFPGRFVGREEAPNSFTTGRSGRAGPRHAFFHLSRFNFWEHEISWLLYLRDKKFTRCLFLECDTMHNDYSVYVAIGHF